MTRERYNEICEEYKKLPGTDEAFEKWQKSLGKEYDEWNRLYDALDNFTDLKLFEWHINTTMTFSLLHNFDAAKIRPLLADEDILRFIHAMYLAGSFSSLKNDMPQRQEWEDEFFKALEKKEIKL